MTTHTHRLAARAAAVTADGSGDGRATAFATRHAMVVDGGQTTGI